ncbi:calmodulin [Pseudoalteromonas porphyrae]|uniref:Calmodulin n=2 Tax=Pseudoalteromonas TaxID=53246 RepID=A0A0N0LUF1_9GAMM|nr:MULTISPECIES: calmodulin [Pseudoalteromonas]KPH57001.1 calmodulin [Pseudoalteromonas porphyrae]KPH93115.1 calmodulin [Pseudoalteromonas porphyrae]NMR27206.1 calmodulin [Pseudoalteromonas sp. NEC-BIFX-2020_015]NNG45059.1 calmodulin [Pseudoalteromonas sp. NEC-BIFX-2020_002]
MNTLNKALALIALASSSVAFAATDFDTLDVDGNGAISQSEASVDAELMGKFTELDIDQNGELSKEEFSKA